MNVSQRAKARGRYQQTYLFHTLNAIGQDDVYKAFKRRIKIDSSNTPKGRARKTIVYCYVYKLTHIGKQINAMRLIEGNEELLPETIEEILLGGQKGVWV